jgi:hypothetical protein
VWIFQVKSDYIKKETIFCFVLFLSNFILSYIKLNKQEQ